MKKTDIKYYELFYRPPKDEYFEELKNLCLRFWEVYEEFPMYTEEGQRLMDEYRQSKIDQIKDLKNEGCNFVSMVQMVHQNSREILARHLSLETRNAISMRLYGPDNEFDPFNIWNIKNSLHDA